MPKFVMAALFAACALCPPAPGQGETTSAIAGSVSDPAEAAIAGATVTVTSADTGMKRSVRTDASGRFSFPQLKPGTYLVKAEAEHFETRQNNSVVAGLGQRQTVDFTLRIAASSQFVNVNEQGPIVNTANANTSSTLASAALEVLPIP